MVVMPANPTLLELEGTMVDGLTSALAIFRFWKKAMGQGGQSVWWLSQLKKNIVKSSNSKM